MEDIIIMEDERHMLCLMVTREEEELLLGIMRHNDMDIIRGYPAVSNTSPVEIANDHVGIDQDNILEVGDIQPDPPIARHIDGLPECPFCFCAPCVTSETFRQSWWPVQNTIPNQLNRPFRNKLYKLFWSAMYNRDVWKDRRYQDKKLAVLQRDNNLKKYVSHRRDIMPNCVANRVRNWLPKTNSEQYVGHLWENNP